MKKILMEWIKREKAFQKHATLEKKAVSLIKESAYREVLRMQ